MREAISSVKEAKPEPSAAARRRGRGRRAERA